MRKKVFAALLAVCMVVAMLPVSAFAADPAKVIPANLGEVDNDLAPEDGLADSDSYTATLDEETNTITVSAKNLMAHETSNDTIDTQYGVRYWVGYGILVPENLKGTGTDNKFYWTGIGDLPEDSVIKAGKKETSTDTMTKDGKTYATFYMALRSGGVTKGWLAYETQAEGETEATLHKYVVDYSNVTLKPLVDVTSTSGASAVKVQENTVTVKGTDVQEDTKNGKTGYFVDASFAVADGKNIASSKNDQASAYGDLVLAYMGVDGSWAGATTNDDGKKVVTVYAELEDAAGTSVTVGVFPAGTDATKMNATDNTKENPLYTQKYTVKADPASTKYATSLSGKLYEGENGTGDNAGKKVISVNGVETLMSSFGNQAMTYDESTKTFKLTGTAALTKFAAWGSNEYSYYMLLELTSNETDNWTATPVYGTTSGVSAPFKFTNTKPDGTKFAVLVKRLDVKDGAFVNYELKNADGTTYTVDLSGLIQGAPVLTVAPVTGATALLADQRKASDLYESEEKKFVVADPADGKYAVTGTAKYQKSWLAFDTSAADKNPGWYLPIKFTNPAESYEGFKNVILPGNKTVSAEEFFEDGILVKKLADKTNFDVTFTYGGETAAERVTYTFDLSKLVLNPAPSADNVETEGDATATQVTEEDLKKIIDNAVAEAVAKALQDEIVVDEKDVKITAVNVTNKDSNTLSIPQGAVNQLIRAEETVVTMQNGTVTLPKAVLDDNKTERRLILEVTSNDEVASAPTVAAAYDVELKGTTNTALTVEGYTNTPITLVFEFDNSSAKLSDPTLAYYNADGKIVKIVDSKATKDSKTDNWTITGTTDHLSTFVIVDLGEVTDMGYSISKVNDEKAAALGTKTRLVELKGDFKPNKQVMLAKINYADGAAYYTNVDLSGKEATIGYTSDAVSLEIYIVNDKTGADMEQYAYLKVDLTK